MRAMAILIFDESRRADITAKIPEEQARVSELRGRGTVTELYIQANLSRVWLVLQGNSEAELRSIVESLPLYQFVTNLELVELAPLR